VDSCEYSIRTFVVFDGYVETAPERLSQMNPDIVACVVVFADVGDFSGSFSLLCERVPSDTTVMESLPVQMGWGSTSSDLRQDLVCAGSVPWKLIAYSTQLSGFWLAASFGSIFLGMLLGQSIVFCRYYHDIQGSES
jgi:hypothetical protein